MAKPILIRSDNSLQFQWKSLNYQRLGGTTCSEETTTQSTFTQTQRSSARYEFILRVIGDDNVTTDKVDDGQAKD